MSESPLYIYFFRLIFSFVSLSIFLFFYMIISIPPTNWVNMPLFWTRFSSKQDVIWYTRELPLRSPKNHHYEKKEEKEKKTNETFSRHTEREWQRKDIVCKRKSTRGKYSIHVMAKQLTQCVYIFSSVQNELWRCNARCAVGGTKNNTR